MMTTKALDFEDFDFSNVVITTDIPTLKGIQRDDVFGLILRKANANKVIVGSAFVEGLASLNKCLTPSYKLTSKKFSVWSLVARHLDLPTKEIIKGIDTPGIKKLIKSFQFSKLGRQAPAFGYDREMASKENAGEFSDAYICKYKSEEPSKTSYLEITKNLSRWDQNIRFTIRALFANGGESAILQIEYLELIRGIIKELLSKRFNPKYTKHADYEEFEAQKSKKFDTEIKYCELCWRLTKRSSELQQNRTSLGILSLSNRHCDIHDPSNPKSKYRADLRYKKAFDQEILALQFPVLQKSNFPTTLKYTPGYEGELRKAAYDLVHSKLLLKLHLDGTPKKSLAAQVLELKQKGLKQSEIAQILGKSRQEISRANKKLESLLSNKQTIANSGLST
jgi:hypothetical protein